MQAGAASMAKLRQGVMKEKTSIKPQNFGYRLFCNCPLVIQSLFDPRGDSFYCHRGQRVQWLMVLCLARVKYGL